MVRCAYSSDWDGAIKLAWDTFVRFDAPDYSQEGIDNFRKFVNDDMLRKMFVAGHYQLFVATDGARYVGMLSLREKKHISLLFVDRDYHRYGVATALLRYVSEYALAEEGVDTLTVTVNAVDPDILDQINGGIVWRGALLTGREAAEKLIANQLQGIEKIARAGITIKVNTVLIPEINAEHVPEVAKSVAAHGAQLYNIIPLIPQHQLNWCTRPDCALLDATRQKCEQYIRVFRHCQHCRADAAGIPGGNDVSRQLYIRPITMENTFSHG